MFVVNVKFKVLNQENHKNHLPGYTACMPHLNPGTPIYEAGILATKVWVQFDQYYNKRQSAPTYYHYTFKCLQTGCNLNTEREISNVSSNCSYVFAITFILHFFYYFIFTKNIKMDST